MANVLLLKKRIDTMSWFWNISSNENTQLQTPSLPEAKKDGEDTNTPFITDPVPMNDGILDSHPHERADGLASIVRRDMGLHQLVFDVCVYFGRRVLASRFSRRRGV
jgi:hypothetical protein